MTVQMLNKNEQKKHPFALTLGTGPYKYVGCYDLGAALAHQRSFGDTQAAFQYAPRLASGLGSCAHCGRAILNICIISRGDGTLFGVGSDCVLKTAAIGDVIGLSDLERQLRRDRAEKAERRSWKKVDDLQPAYKAALDILESLPHPNAYFASKGKTLRDYYEFCALNPKNMRAAISRAAAV